MEDEEYGDFEYGDYDHSVSQKELLDRCLWVVMIQCEQLFQIQQADTDRQGIVVKM